MSLFSNKTLMITGGTGSFGNAVLNRFLRTDIGEIRIFSRDEKKQDDMRHAEKMYETLLTNEECANNADMKNFHRVSCDKCDFNYDKYFKQGDIKCDLLKKIRFK